MISSNRPFLSSSGGSDSMSLAVAERLVLEAQHPGDVFQRDRALVLDRLAHHAARVVARQAHQVLHQHLVGGLVPAQPRLAHLVVVVLELLLHQRAHLGRADEGRAEAGAHALQVGIEAHLRADEDERPFGAVVVVGDLAEGADRPRQVQEGRRVEKYVDAVLRRLHQLLDRIEQLARLWNVLALQRPAQPLHRGPGEERHFVQVGERLDHREEARLLWRLHHDDGKARAQQQLQLFLLGLHALALTGRARRRARSFSCTPPKPPFDITST